MRGRGFSPAAWGLARSLAGAFDRGSIFRCRGALVNRAPLEHGRGRGDEGLGGAFFPPRFGVNYIVFGVGVAAGLALLSTALGVIFYKLRLEGKVWRAFFDGADVGSYFGCIRDFNRNF